jgi:O-antigen/teichoic acid export membrane protein
VSQPLPSKRAFLATFATGVWTQALTVVTGALTARLLGPEGRGQFAGAQVWPGILGMVALLGINNALSLRAARDKANKGAYERHALRLGLLLSLAGVAAGWFALPLLVPANNPELLWLSRISLAHIPLFVLTSNLMAIDQGVGDFRMFNVARNILTPVYLVLLLGLWVAGIRDVVWFVAALLAANFAVLAWRLLVVQWRQTRASSSAGLFRDGLPFWATGIVAVVRDNAERLLLMFLLGPVALGLYVVAFTASGVHLNVTRSLNLIVFARGAALNPEHALPDAARFFRLMGLLNLTLSLGMVLGMPLLIGLVYGRGFSNSVVPAMLLVAAQFFLSQGAILDEALRARSKPLAGLVGMVLGMAVFATAGVLLAREHGLLGVAGASIAGQFAYWTWMVMTFRRASDGLRLVPDRADVADLVRILRETRRSMMGRLALRTAA